MTSSYVNDLRLNEMATGDASGTWGTVTNTNLELIGEALGFGTEAITTNADTHTSTVADGATDPVRAMFVKYTGTLDSSCTITIAPNTLNRMHFIENGTSGGQNILISQGSGANVTIPPGDTKAVYLNGAGSGAAVIDAFASLSVIDLKVQDDLTFTSDSAVITFGSDNDTTLTHTDGSGLTLNGTNKLMFNDASQFIQGASATVLDIAATDTIELTATNIAVVGTMGATGKITADAGIDIDNINIDGTTIALSSGDLTLDVAGDLIIDTDGAEVKLKDGGTLYGKLHNHNPGNAATSLIVESSVQDQDILLKGNDGGSVITALALDMSAAGEAKFNDNIVMGTAGKGIHLGVTSATASNLLDDYEEGTWTPAFASTNATFSYAQQHGTYTKVGRLIMLSFRLALNQAPGGTTSNGAVVSGLPFNSASLAGSYHGGMFGHYFGINLDSTGVMAYQTHSGGATVELKVVGDNLGEQGVQAQDLLSNAEIRGQIIYHTA